MSKTILHYIYQAAHKYPDRPAIIFDDAIITYRELNERSNRFALHLHHSNVGRETVVAVCMDRSIEMIVALFGIIKAGGAYLPLDPGYPDEHIQLILSKSAVSVMVVRDGTDKAHLFSGETILLNDILLEAYSGTDLPILNEDTDLAYIIYTSGSTGIPKGVAIEHAGLLNRINWMQKDYPIHSGDVLFFKTIFTFDVSVWEIFWWAMHGASVVLLPSGKEHDVRFIYRQIQKYNISVIHFVPSVFSLFLEYLQIRQNIQEISSLKFVFTSGEKLPVQSVNFFNRFFLQQTALLVNLYGPTEASIDVTHYAFCDKTLAYETAPIGSAIDNIRLYVLDKDKNKVPEGVDGYLYISGIGLARGYYNDPELTARKFISDLSVDEDRIYNTGDIVRQINGVFYFVGRSDFQIKLRGLRIELSDIEQHLCSVPGISESVIILEENGGGQFLKAFYKAKVRIPESVLREELSMKIPNYMIPNNFIFLDQFPLLINGKLDRKKLVEFT